MAVQLLFLFSVSDIQRFSDILRNTREKWLGRRGKAEKEACRRGSASKMSLKRLEDTYKTVEAIQNAQ